MTTLEPGEILNAQGARDLLDAILDARGADLTLDFAQVRHLGGQATQVLLSAQKTWAAEKFNFSITNVGAEAREAMIHLGVAEQFGCEVAA